MTRVKRAFTLIELLVVVAIIAILIAILLPSLGKAKDRAQTVKCSNNLRTMYQGLNTYSSEFDGAMCPMKIQPNGIGGQKNSYWFGPQLLGMEYGKNSGLAMKDATTRDRAYQYVMGVLLHCPSDTTPGDVYIANGGILTGTDYAYNRNMGDLSNAANMQSYPSRKMAQLSKQTLLSLETHQGMAEKGDGDYYFSQIGDIFTYDAKQSTTGSRGYSPLAGHPHSGGKKGNMLFADGQILIDDPFKMNTTGGVQQPIDQPNLPAGTDFKWIPDPWHNPQKTAFPY